MLGARDMVQLLSQTAGLGERCRRADDHRSQLGPWAWEQKLLSLPVPLFPLNRDWLTWLHGSCSCSWKQQPHLDSVSLHSLSADSQPGGTTPRASVPPSPLTPHCSQSVVKGGFGGAAFNKAPVCTALCLVWIPSRGCRTPWAGSITAAFATSLQNIPFA